MCRPRAWDVTATWSYDDASLAPGSASETPTVQVTLTNTSNRDSREVIQAYLQPADPDQPVRLVGWTTVEVPAGAQTVVDVTTEALLWRRWDTTTNTRGIPLSDGELLIARGLGDIKARALPYDRSGPFHVRKPSRK